MKKYPLKKQEVEQLLVLAESTMYGRYREFYERLGLKRGRNGNFYCINSVAHGGGTDNNPSMSIDNKTGVWHCFTCGIEGNFQSYWREYVKGGVYGDAYTDFIIEFLGLSSAIGNLKSIVENSVVSQEIRKYREFMVGLHKQLDGYSNISTITSKEIISQIRGSECLDMQIVDDAVAALLSNKQMMSYLYDTRRINQEIVEKYKIGWYKHDMAKKDGGVYTRYKFCFPQIDTLGRLVNIKLYDPFCTDVAFKWAYPEKGRKSIPGPSSSMVDEVIYIMEGEPDCYCALSHGLSALTMGSKSITDVDEAFGYSAKDVFVDKEVVIVFDADEAGRDGSIKVADSVIKYARQVKIVDLDKREMNPYGLDPEIKKDVTKGGVTKQKRLETDFTDFMRKNGFDGGAMEKFNTLLSKTPVYAGKSRKKEKELRVTLQESRYPRYQSEDGSIKLEVTAKVCDVSDFKAYNYPNSVIVKCISMNNKSAMDKRCANECPLPSMEKFGEGNGITFNLVRGIVDDGNREPGTVFVRNDQVLSTIGVVGTKRQQALKEILEIPTKCTKCSIVAEKMSKLIHARLVSDSRQSHSDIGIDAYIGGDADVLPNKTYKFLASQSVSPDDQCSVLIADHYDTTTLAVDRFEMTPDKLSTLSVFQQRRGESVKDALERKYKAFGAMAGVSGRLNLIEAVDLTFMSACEMQYSLLPEINRGYMEILCLGDTRCCKSLICKFIHNRYKIGEIIEGGSTLTRTGLIGGMSSNRHTPVWGKIPTNNKGVITIDEMNNMDPSLLTDLTPIRSSGVATLNMKIQARTPAMTRKIMLTNQREGYQNMAFSCGLDELMFLCREGQVLSRFDLALVLRASDVPVSEFANIGSYDPNEYNEYQCQTLVMFAHSRKASDYVFEDGVDDIVNDSQTSLIEEFHESTHLINQEARAKIMRIAMAKANSLVSVHPEDINKVLVTKEHVLDAVRTIREYCLDKNLDAKKYSAKVRSEGELGDMRFMLNIFKFIDYKSLISSSGEVINDSALKQIFYDYLVKVYYSEVAMIDAINDDNKTTGLKPADSIHKLIGTMISRKCLKRSRYGYTLTPQFVKWAQEYADGRDQGQQLPTSNILENFRDKHDISIHQDGAQVVRVYKRSK